MFIPVKERPVDVLRPEVSKIRPSDWDVLADFWYVIASEEELEDKPLARRILDVDLVVYRSGEDSITVALDVCPHRLVKLSSGQIIDGEIECPFHGLRYGADGHCSLVPAIGAGKKLPPKYRLRTFPVQVKYGLIWTCLGDSEVNQVPYFPRLEGLPKSDYLITSNSVWEMPPPRQIENFCDLAHLAFVHATALGGDKEQPIKVGEITEDDVSLTLRAEYTEKPVGGEATLCHYRYRIVLPFSVDFLVIKASDGHIHLDSYDIATPINAHSSRVYQLMIKHGLPEDSLEGFVAVLDSVNQEDIDVLSTLTRLDMPLTQHFEIHLPVDNISHAYRKRLVELGLGKN